MIDLDYWCRMLRFGALFAQGEVVGSFRLTPTSLSTALVRAQSRQTIGLLPELRQDESTRLGPADLAS
jgi:hypothetical protein